VLRLAASNDALAEPLAVDAPDITAQVAFSVRTEQCLRLSDFLSHVARTQAFRAGSRGDAASPRSTTSSMASRDLHSTSSEEAP